MGIRIADLARSIYPLHIITITIVAVIITIVAVIITITMIVMITNIIIMMKIKKPVPPIGIRIADLARSTAAWWKSNPLLQLKEKRCLCEIREEFLKNMEIFNGSCH